MSPTSTGQRVRLSIDVEPGLRRKIKIAAANRDLSIRDYVESVLRQAIAQEDSGETSADSAAWTQLSTRSFARDWESEADQVYDQLS